MAEEGMRSDCSCEAKQKEKENARHTERQEVKKEKQTHGNMHAEREIGQRADGN